MVPLGSARAQPGGFIRELGPGHRPRTHRERSRSRTQRADPPVSASARAEHSDLRASADELGTCANVVIAADDLPMLRFIQLLARL
jgi:hypothetical protein